MRGYVGGIACLHNWIDFCFRDPFPSEGRSEDEIVQSRIETKVFFPCLFQSAARDHIWPTKQSEGRGGVEFLEIKMTKGTVRVKIRRKWLAVCSPLPVVIFLSSSDMCHQMAF